MALGSSSQQEALPVRCALLDGAAVLIWAVLPGDAARLERLFYRLSRNPFTANSFCRYPISPTGRRG